LKKKINHNKLSTHGKVAKMEYRVLGNTGLKVSVVGIGSLGFLRARATPGEIEKVVNRALDLEINIIDTARVYGKGEIERAIGRVTKNRWKECIILSRVPGRAPKEFAQSINESLRNLNVETIDIYQVHNVTRSGELEKLMNNGVFDELKRAQKAGKIKFIGISSHARAEDTKRMINSGEIDVITVSYNLIRLQRQVTDGEDISITEKEILPLAKEKGLGVTIMKPFGGGILAKNSLSGGVSISPVQALKFVISNPYVDTVIPGIGSIAELEEDIKAGDPNVLLSRKDIARLQEDAKNWGPDFCRNCGYCLPCSEDISIPKIRGLLLNYKLGGENGKNRARKAYDNLEVKASACSECKECEERCPYHQAISEKMREAQEIFE